MLDREQDIIAEARRNPDAFRELYRHYFPRLYGYVIARVERREDAEDIISDIFLKVVEYFSRFEYRGEGSFATWLFRIAYSQVNEFFRRNKFHLPLDDDLQSDAPSHIENVMQAEQFAQLHGLIASLSPRRREIITLKFFGKLKNREIAAILNLDERTIASHLCRALEDLQALYLEKEINP